MRDDQSYTGGIVRFLGLTTMGAVGAYAGYRAFQGGASEVESIVAAKGDKTRQALTSLILRTAEKKTVANPLNSAKSFIRSVQDNTGQLRFNQNVLDFFANAAEVQYGYEAGSIKGLINKLIQAGQDLSGLKMGPREASMLQDFMKVFNKDVAYEHFTSPARLGLDQIPMPTRLSVSKTGTIEGLATQLKTQRPDLVEAVKSLHESIQLSFAGKEYAGKIKPLFRIHRFDGMPYKLEAVYKIPGARPIKMAFNIVNNNKVLISPEQGLAANARKILFMPPEVREAFFSGKIKTIDQLYQHVLPYDVATVKLASEILRQTSTEGLTPLQINNLLKDALEQASPGIVFGEESLTSPAFEKFGVSSDLEKIVQNQVFPFAPEYDPERGRVTVPLYKNATLHSGEGDFRTPQTFYTRLREIEAAEEGKARMGIMHNISSQQVAKEIFADFGQGTFSRELLDPQMPLSKPQQRIKPPFTDLNPEFAPKVTTPELENLIYKQQHMSRVFMNTYMGDPEITQRVMNKMGLPELYGEVSAVSKNITNNLLFKDIAHVRVGLNEGTLIGEGLGTVFAKMVAGAEAMETGKQEALGKWKDVRDFIMDYHEGGRLKAAKSDAYGAEAVSKYFKKVMSNAEYRQKVFKYLQAQNPEFLTVSPGSSLALSMAGKTYTVKDYGQAKSIIAGIDVIPSKHGMNVELILNNVYRAEHGAKFMSEFKTTVGQVHPSEQLTQVAAAEATIRELMRKNSKLTIEKFDPVLDAFFNNKEVPRGYKTLYKQFTRKYGKMHRLLSNTGIDILGVEGRKKFATQQIGVHNVADLENLIRLKETVEHNPRALGLSVAGKRYQRTREAFGRFEEFFDDYLSPRQVKLPNGQVVNTYAFNMNKYTDFKGLRGRIDRFYNYLREQSGLPEEVINLMHSSDYGMFRFSYSFGLMPQMRGAGNPAAINHFVLEMLRASGMEKLATEMVVDSNLDLTGWKGAIQLTRDAVKPPSDAAIITADRLSEDTLLDIYQRSGEDRINYLRKLTGTDANKFMLDLGKTFTHPETNEAIRYIPFATYRDPAMVGTFITDEGDRIIKPIDNAFHRVWIATQQAKDDELLGHAVVSWFNTVSDTVLSHGATDVLKMQLQHSMGLQGGLTPVTSGLLKEIDATVRSAGNKRVAKMWAKLLAESGLEGDMEKTLDYTAQVSRNVFKGLAAASDGLMTKGVVFRHPTFSPTSVLPTNVLDAETFMKKAIAINEMAKMGVSKLNHEQAQQVQQVVRRRMEEIFGSEQAREHLVGIPRTIASLVKGDWDADVFNLFIPQTEKGQRQAALYLSSFTKRSNDIAGRMGSFVDALNELTSRKGLKMNADKFAESLVPEYFGRFSPKGKLFSEMLGENIAAKKAVGRINVAVSGLRFGIANSGIPKEDVAKLNVLLSNLEENAITAGHGSSKALENAIDIMEALDVNTKMSLSQRRSKVVQTIKDIYNYEELAKRADMSEAVSAIDETLGILDKHFDKIFKESSSAESMVEQFAYRTKNRANPYGQLRKIISTLQNENIAEDKLSGLGSAMAAALEDAAGINKGSRVTEATSTASRVVGAAIDEGVKGLKNKWVLGGLLGLGAVGFLLSPGDPEAKINEARAAQEIANPPEGGNIPQGASSVNPPVARMAQYKGGLKINAIARRSAGGNINQAIKEIQSVLGAQNVNVRFNRAPAFAASRDANRLLRDSNSYKWNQRGPYGG